jgi:hypothetical protein
MKQFEVFCQEWREDRLKRKEIFFSKHAALSLYRGMKESGSYQRIQVVNLKTGKVLKDWKDPKYRNSVL